MEITTERLKEIIIEVVNGNDEIPGFADAVTNLIISDPEPREYTLETNPSSEEVTHNYGTEGIPQAVTKIDLTFYIEEGSERTGTVVYEKNSGGGGNWIYNIFNMSEKDREKRRPSILIG